MGEKRNAFKAYEWKFERDLPLGRRRPTRKDKIEVGVREINGRARTGLIWLSIGRNVGLL
jgi:hypothetical protein